jgi:hypothetical protein
MVEILFALHSNIETSPIDMRSRWNSRSFFVNIIEFIRATERGDSRENCLNDSRVHCALPKWESTRQITLERPGCIFFPYDTDVIGGIHSIQKTMLERQQTMKMTHFNYISAD